METTDHSTESGFSLVELMIAMVVTLIVTGAVYGLIAGGQNAFRREPELTDRQQNIRLAMDIVMRDLASAGEGMPGFLQTFGRFKDGTNTAITGCAECPMGPNNEKTDEIDVVANPTSEDPEDTCDYMGSASNVRLKRDQTNFGTGSTVIFFFPDGRWTVRYIQAEFGNKGGPGPQCDGGELKTDLSFRSGDDPTGLNVSGGLCAGGSVGSSDEGGPCNPDKVGNGEFITYRIRNGADGVPNLERRTTGNFSGTFTGSTAFQTIARGIEDLQVEYAQAQAPDTWIAETDSATAGAPEVVKDNYGSLITKIRITLQARAMDRRLQGIQTSATGGNAVRGQLQQVAALRMALRTLQNQPDTGGDGQPAPLWN